jgi:hypothetical protein
VEVEGGQGDIENETQGVRRPANTVKIMTN